MGLIDKDKVGEHLLCVAIDLEEARKELLDAEIKVKNLALKYNKLISLSNQLQNNDRTSDNSNISNLPSYFYNSDKEG